VIVDDGSPEPIEPQIRDLISGQIVCVRKPNGGGPAARNHGAAVAHGSLILFVDQDLRLPPDFVRTHLELQAELGSGAVSAFYENRLLGGTGPFARWYASVSAEWERSARRGGKAVSAGIFEVHPVMLSSTNLSLSKAVFEAAGGFPVFRKTGVEDQAFGLLLGRLGVKVYRTDRVCPLHVEARAELRRFCDRQRIGSAATVELLVRFPEVFGGLEASEQHRINGPLRTGREPVSLSLQKLLKSALARPWPRRAATSVVRALERVAPSTSLPARGYRALVSASTLQGWREGLRDFGLWSG
jgi:hypothetical protein